MTDIQARNGAAIGTPRARTDSIPSQTLGEWFGSGGYRGCAFISAVVESGDGFAHAVAASRRRNEELVAILQRLLPRPQAGDLRVRARRMGVGGTIGEVRFDEAAEDSRSRNEAQIMKVVIVVFDGVQALDVAGPMDVFAEANNLLPPEQQYQITLVGMRPGNVRCANGLELNVETDYLHYEEQPDLLLVAGGPKLPDLRPSASFLQWLSAKAEGSRRFGSVCNGAFPLGHAGLLNGKEVTAHWHHVDRLTAQFPRARVRPDKIFVRDGSLFTCAGVTAGVDLCLALVTEDWGHEMALRIAKQLIVYIRRDGGQSQYSPYLAVGPKEETIVAKVLRYVTDHISEQVSIEQLADAVAVSRRTFSRIFAKDAKMTPSAFVEQVRVDFSRKLLEETDLPLKTVAFRCGFHSGNHMRVIFARRLDTTPREYRQRFRNEEIGDLREEAFDLSTVTSARSSLGGASLLEAGR